MLSKTWCLKKTHRPLFCRKRALYPKESVIFVESQDFKFSPDSKTNFTGHVPLFANFFSQIFLANYRCLPTFGKQRFTANFFSEFPNCD